MFVILQGLSLKQLRKKKIQSENPDKNDDNYRIQVKNR